MDGKKKSPVVVPTALGGKNEKKSNKRKRLRPPMAEVAFRRARRKKVRFSRCKMGQTKNTVAGAEVQN